MKNIIVLDKDTSPLLDVEVADDCLVAIVEKKNNPPQWENINFLYKSDKNYDVLDFMGAMKYSKKINLTKKYRKSDLLNLLLLMVITILLIDKFLL